METVHFTQQTFRLLMDSFARPGEQQMLQRERQMEGLYNATAATLLTLVDGEVSFYVKDETLQREVRTWTNAKLVTVEQADFIILPASSTVAEVEAVIQQAKIGTLVDPQQSATIILEMTREEETVFVLRGPGIKGERQMKARFMPQWLAKRAHKNREFPLGIDIICVYEDGAAFALPRTTTIQEVNN